MTKIKIKNNLILPLVDLVIKKKDIIKTSILYSPEIVDNFKKEEKEALNIEGEILEKYFKNNWLFISMRNKTGSKIYCVKIKKNTEFFLFKKLSILENHIINYIFKDYECITKEIFLLDLDGLYIITFTYEEIKITKFYYLNDRLLSRSAINLFCNKILKENIKDFSLLYVFGANRQIVEKLPTKYKLQIPYFHENCNKLLHDPGVLNKLMLFNIQKDNSLLTNLQDYNIIYDLEEISSFLPRKKLNVLLFVKNLKENDNNIQNFLEKNEKYLNTSNFFIINHAYFLEETMNLINNATILGLKKDED